MALEYIAPKPIDLYMPNDPLTTADESTTLMTDAYYLNTHLTGVTDGQKEYFKRRNDAIEYFKNHNFTISNVGLKSSDIANELFVVFNIADPVFNLDASTVKMTNPVLAGVASTATPVRYLTTSISTKSVFTLTNDIVKGNFPSVKDSTIVVTPPDTVPRIYLRNDSTGSTGTPIQISVEYSRTVTFPDTRTKDIIHYSIARIFQYIMEKSDFENCMIKRYANSRAATFTSAEGGYVYGFSTTWGKQDTMADVKMPLGSVQSTVYAGNSSTAKSVLNKYHIWGAFIPEEYRLAVATLLSNWASSYCNLRFLSQGNSVNANNFGLRFGPDTLLSIPPTDINKHLHRIYTLWQMDNAYASLPTNHPAKKRRQIMFAAEFFNSYFSGNQTGTLTSVATVTSTDIYNQIKFDKHPFILKDDMYIKKFFEHYKNGTSKGFTSNSSLIISPLTAVQKSDVEGFVESCLTNNTQTEYKLHLNSAFRAFSQFTPYTYTTTTTTVNGVQTTVRTVNDPSREYYTQTGYGTTERGYMQAGIYSNKFMFFPPTLCLGRIALNEDNVTKSNLTLYGRNVNSMVRTRTADGAYTEFSTGTQTQTASVIYGPNYEGNEMFVIPHFGKSSYKFYQGYATTTNGVLTVDKSFIGGKLDIPQDYLPENITYETFKTCFEEAFDYIYNLNDPLFTDNKLIKGNWDYFYNIILNNLEASYISSHQFTGTESYYDSIKEYVQDNFNTTSVLRKIVDNEDLFSYFKIYIKLQNSVQDSDLRTISPFSNAIRTVSGIEYTNLEYSLNYIDSLPLSAAHIVKMASAAPADAQYKTDFGLASGYDQTPSDAVAAMTAFLATYYPSYESTFTNVADPNIYDERIYFDLVSNKYVFNRIEYTPYLGKELFIKAYYEQTADSDKAADFTTYYGDLYKAIMVDDQYFYDQIVRLHGLITPENQNLTINRLIIRLFNNKDVISGSAIIKNPSILAEARSLILNYVDKNNEDKSPTDTDFIIRVTRSQLIDYLQKSLEIRSYFYTNPYFGQANYLTGFRNYMSNYRSSNDPDSPVGIATFVLYDEQFTSDVELEIKSIIAREYYSVLRDKVLNFIDKFPSLKEHFENVYTYHNAGLTSDEKDEIYNDILTKIHEIELRYPFESDGLYDTLSSTENKPLFIVLVNSLYVRNNKLNSITSELRDLQYNQIYDKLNQLLPASAYLNYRANQYYKDNILSIVFNLGSTGTILNLNTIANYSSVEFERASENLLRSSSMFVYWKARFQELLIAKPDICSLLVNKRDLNDKYSDVILFIKGKIESPTPSYDYTDIYNDLNLISPYVVRNEIEKFKLSYDKISDTEILKDLIRLSYIYDTVVPRPANAVKPINLRTYEVENISEADLKAAYTDLNIFTQLCNNPSNANRTMLTINDVRAGWVKIYQTYKKYRTESLKGFNRDINELDIILTQTNVSVKSRKEKELISRFESY